MEDLLIATATETTVPAWQVIVLGLGIVFLGLICIILLIKLMSVIISLFTKKQKAQQVPASSSAMPDGATIAAIASCLAEEMGTDVKAIRIKSIKRI